MGRREKAGGVSTEMRVDGRGEYGGMDKQRDKYIFEKKEWQMEGGRYTDIKN